MMKLAASRRVISGLPLPTVIGSSNFRDQDMGGGDIDADRAKREGPVSVSCQKRVENPTTERERMNTKMQQSQRTHPGGPSGWLGAPLTRQAEVLGSFLLIALGFRGSSPP